MRKIFSQSIISSIWARSFGSAEGRLKRFKRIYLRGAEQSFSELTQPCIDLVGTIALERREARRGV